MSEKLKPCPLCGGRAILRRTQGGYGGNPTAILDGWEVHCVNNCCHTKTHESKTYQEDDGRVVIKSNGAEKAIKAWNTRANERPKGKWEDFLTGSGMIVPSGRCNNCGFKAWVAEIAIDMSDMSFCPNCGAEMRKVKDNA